MKTLENITTLAIKQEGSSLMLHTLPNGATTLLYPTEVVSAIGAAKDETLRGVTNDLSDAQGALAAEQQYAQGLRKLLDNARAQREEAQREVLRLTRDNTSLRAINKDLRNEVACRRMLADLMDGFSRIN